MNNTSYIIRTALTVALGGFLFGFDAIVISGVNGYIVPEFNLGEFELGWAVACLTLISTLTMFFVGPISDKIGRKKVLAIGAVAFAISALGSALAPNYVIFIIFRMLGGVGVGTALVIGPLYISEISPGNLRGRLVSFNQLNIVIAFTVAYFTNLMIRNLSSSGLEWVHSIGMDANPWRWMLGLEVIPAALFFLALFFVPESPRWLLMKGQDDEALDILKKANGNAGGQEEMDKIKENIAEEEGKPKSSFIDLFAPAMKTVLTIGIVIAILQQITGINSVFFYANMIFEQSGIGTDAAFTQAVFVGIINLVFTLISMALIDRLGRRPLMLFGVAGVVVSMFFLAYQFGQATYTIKADAISEFDTKLQTALSPLVGTTFEDDVSFKRASIAAATEFVEANKSEMITPEEGVSMDQAVAAAGAELVKTNESAIISSAISINPMLVLLGILAFVASFAISLGPVMWVLLSEMFPNRIRGIAISFVAGINSVVSFIIQLIFPWELANLGTSKTFLIYGVFGLIGLILIIRILPETKGKSLEELEKILVK